jgi:hypothetical protein
MAPLTTPAPPTSAPGPKINSTTDNLPVPIAITTPLLRQKRKLNPLSPPEPGKSSYAFQKQCVLQEFYNPQSWYNTPAFSQTPSLHTFKPSTLSPHTLEPSTMAALRMKIKGFAILTNDEYVELAATIKQAVVARHLRRKLRGGRLPLRGRTKRSWHKFDQRTNGKPPKERSTL